MSSPADTVAPHVSWWAVPAIRRFFFSQGVGQIADAMTAMALAASLLGADEGVDPSHLLGTLGVAVLPYAIAGPLSGVVADSSPRRRLLVGAHLARAGVTAIALVAVTDGQRTTGLVAAAALLSLARLVYTVRAAALPTLTTGHSLVRADAAALFVGMVATGSGAVVGTLGAQTSPGAVLAVAVLGQIASALGFATISAPLGGCPTITPEPRELWRGLRQLWSSTPARRAMAIAVSARCLLGALFATTVLIGANRLGLEASGYAAALAITGIGSFAGTISAAWTARRLGVRGLVLGTFACIAIGTAAAAFSGAVTMMAIAATVSFFAFQNLRVSTDAVVQMAIPDRARARVFSLYDAAYNLAYFGGAAIALAADLAADGRIGHASVALAAIVTGVVLAPIADIERPVGRSVDEHAPAPVRLSVPHPEAAR